MTTVIEKIEAATAALIMSIPLAALGLPGLVDAIVSPADYTVSMTVLAGLLSAPTLGLVARIVFLKFKGE
jgi:hypothetical protein